MGDHYEIAFDEEDHEALAAVVRDGIDGELSDAEADAVVAGVADHISTTIADQEDAETVVDGVGDRIVSHLVDGDHADDLVQDVADIVLDEIPLGSLIVKRAVKRIVRSLMGDSSNRVVGKVGDRIVHYLVAGGHAEALVGETLGIVVDNAEADDYSEELVAGVLDEGLSTLVDNDSIEPIAEDVQDSYPAEAET